MPINTPNMGSIVLLLILQFWLLLMHYVSCIISTQFFTSSGFTSYVCIIYATIVYIMEPTLQNLSHYGDILAIPFFFLLIVYFYKIQNKTTLEYVLLAFVICGFILDIFYTYLFVHHTNNSSF